ncbi:MAG TPA: hypothetical protein EYN66_21640 [Myxococcales bacterium]|nr:hypothetical protein [Myxococcales bacterium]
MWANPRVLFPLSARQGLSNGTIWRDGVVYVGLDDGNVYAINSEMGTQKWGLNVGDKVSSTLAIAADGTLLIGTVGGHLFGIGP